MKNFFLATAAALLLSAGTLTADVIFDGSPGTSAPPATMGNYTITPFGDDTRANFLNVSTVEGPTGDISFSPTLNHRSIGGGWATWSHGYTGDVYVTGGNTIEITLPAGTKAFRFYAEPNSFSTFSIEAVTDNGTSSGEIDVTGNSGAQYYGFYTDDNSDIETITVTLESTTTSFAIGEFGIANCGNPMISVALDKTLLWPPNHRMHDITADVDVEGGCGEPTIELISVTSNESDNGVDDGNTVNDITGVGSGADYNFAVRAERCGSCTGRVYTVTYKVTDEAGNFSYATATVTVPIGNGGSGGLD
jgi:hypothetical protein